MKMTTPRELYHHALCPSPDTLELVRPVFENVVAGLLKDGRQPTEAEINWVIKAFDQAKEAGSRIVSAIECLYRATGDAGPDGLDYSLMRFLEEFDDLERELLRKLGVTVPREEDVCGL